MSIILKVMAGDQFNIRVSSWYKKNGATPSSPNSIATDLVTSLINSLTGTGGPVHGAITSAQLTSSGVVPTSVSNFLSNQPAPGATKPKAYVNWILLDEQFKFVQSSSGAEQVPDESSFGTAPNNQVYTHIKNGLSIAKSGYLYVFVSNETPNIDVYFDNLQVTHIRGPILEETHYYPFGLTMTGISSKALNFGEPESKKKFIGQILDDDLGLNWYQFKHRNHDPQIGRFVQVDPLCDSFVYNSTYAYAENKVGMGFDLEGLELSGFNAMFHYSGIDVEQANKTTQAYSNYIYKKAEPVINVTKDVITIGAGVTLLVASGGTATPLLAGLAGSATVAGGTMKLVFDIQGNTEASKQIPTTLSGTAVFLGNGISEATTGDKLFSDDVKTTLEFTEGVLTLKVTGFDKMNDLKKVSNMLSGLSLTLDGLSPETAQALKNVLGTFMTNNNNTTTPATQRAVVDNTYVKKPVVILPPNQ